MTSKEDWFLVVDQEDGEQFVCSLIEEILNRSQEVLFEKHIESQVLPYAVQFSKTTLLKIIEWEFFRKDLGKIDSAAWLPDEEPVPVTIDSWARGAIALRSEPPPLPQPKKPYSETLSMSSLSLETPPETEEHLSPTAAATLGPTSIKEKGRTSVVRMSANSISKRDSKSDRVRASDMSITSSSSRSGRKRSGGRRNVLQGGAAHTTAVTAVQALEQSIQEENKRTMARIANLEKDGGRADYTSDHDGRVVLVKKLAPRKLQSTGVRAMVIPEEPQTGPAGGAHGAAESPYHLARSHANAPSKKQHGAETTGRESVTGFGRLGMSLRQITQRHQSFNSISSMASLRDTSGFVEDSSLDMPPLSETIKVAAGVVLIEGENVKRGLYAPAKREPGVLAEPSQGQAPKRAAETGRRSHRPTDLQAPGLAPTAGPGPAPPAAIPTGLNASLLLGSDPILSEVLSKARPSLKPIPFPLSSNPLTAKDGARKPRPLPDISDRQDSGHIQGASVKIL
ncbi:uncharacterized protein BJ171DRAFT_637519 [Polychytrium aggregatum]|uniref:uncharacterized protein n=1 Tax=Polychytrium aggregatum TaxID=110093 RepID=UPI0022FDD708|nr:uncharacterized protein BJ171DRAFT_637519 [Polychytrium aggregatum]KAI9193418.1 hypothetical protein BJ171DRAFT_637519 [Polychytrium aggregatum]